MPPPSNTHRIDPVRFTGQEGTAGGDESFLTLPGGVKMHFCWCPRPEQPFKIGSPVGETDRSSDEKPTWITLSHGFWLAKHPCSQAQWLAVMGWENRSRFKDNPEQPVENVSWNDSVAFCQKAGTQAGWQLALPSEAQWEYACRGGRGIDLPLGIGDGRGLNGQIANFDGSTPYGGSFDWSYREQSIPSGTFPPNAWGLHDMHGQVWEWCMDWRAAYPTSSPATPLKDPMGYSDNRARVLRGGSSRNDGVSCRTACNMIVPGHLCENHFGFRPALVSEVPINQKTRVKS